MGRRRQYTAKLKCQVVREALTGEKTPGQIAKAYGVHPNALGLWKRHVMEHGAELFEPRGGAGDGAKRIAELEQLLGRKAVAIALLKHCLGRSR